MAEPPDATDAAGLRQIRRCHAEADVDSVSLGCLHGHEYSRVRSLDQPDSLDSARRLSQSGERRSQTEEVLTMGTGRPVVFFQIACRDAERQREFYQALFGWKIDTESAPGFGFVEPGIGGPEEGVGGVISPAGENPGFVAIFVQVLSLVDTLAQVERMGGKTLLPPTDTPRGPTIAQFSDPEGNVIGLVKQ
jgi:predicted enzyme related to lactoylglutathione lyase